MPTQIQIAEHLDMSERQCRDVLKSLGIDWQDESMDYIRVSYIRDLREKAAGRFGDAQDTLTKARTDEARASAELKQLQIKEKAGELIPVAEIEPILTAMITAARQELLAMPGKVVTEIKAMYGVEIDSGLVESIVCASLEHLANGFNNEDQEGA